MRKILCVMMCVLMLPMTKGPSLTGAATAARNLVGTTTVRDAASAFTRGGIYSTDQRLEANKTYYQGRVTSTVAKQSARNTAATAAKTKADKEAEEKAIKDAGLDGKNKKNPGEHGFCYRDESDKWYVCVESSAARILRTASSRVLGRKRAPGTYRLLDNQTDKILIDKAVELGYNMDQDAQDIEIRGFLTSEGIKNNRQQAGFCKYEDGAWVIFLPSATSRSGTEPVPLTSKEHIIVAIGKYGTEAQKAALYTSQEHEHEVPYERADGAAPAEGGVSSVSQTGSILGYGAAETDPQHSPDAFADLLKTKKGPGAEGNCWLSEDKQTVYVMGKNREGRLEKQILQDDANIDIAIVTYGLTAHPRYAEAKRHQDQIMAATHGGGAEYGAAAEVEKTRKAAADRAAAEERGKGTGFDAWKARQALALGHYGKEQ